MFLRFRNAKKNQRQTNCPEQVKAHFLKFRRIQKLNTKSLEIMAEMDRILGGDFIFDRAFMETSIRELGETIYHAVYCLNAMSDDRYIKLYDRFQELRDVLDDILAGGMGPYAKKHTLSYSTIGWELEPVAGFLNACLAEAFYHLGIPVPDGFAVTVSGCSAILESGSSVNSFITTDELNRPADEAADAIINELSLFSERNRKASEIMIRPVPISDKKNIPAASPFICTATPEKLLNACIRVLSDYCSINGINKKDVKIALAVHENLKADIQGTVQVEPLEGFSSGAIKIKAFYDKNTIQETYVLKRIFPYSIVQSEITPKSIKTDFFPAADGLKPGDKGLNRGHALIKPDFLRSIAENAIKFWRMAGEQYELHWVKSKDGRLFFIDFISHESSRLQTTNDKEESVNEIEAEILASGGDVVQSGAAAGLIKHILENDTPDSFPEGSIAVVKTASPKFFSFLRKSSAFITEIGSPASHLATLARELRVPSVFGLEKAMSLLPDGMEVTFDASEKTVYKGINEKIIAASNTNAGLTPEDEEYSSLKRLLRWITPLELTEPDPEDFSAKGCRSYHDIIHFVHECSVERLIGLQDTTKGNIRSFSSKVDLDIPIDLYMIDLGGALAQNNCDYGHVSIENLKSQPLKSFLRGICDKRVWSSSPARLKPSDIISGMSRFPADTHGMPRYSGTNHVLAADCYMNLGLLLGYHYTIIDSYFGNNANQNYIYFRFAGGFADKGRRSLRADFIRSVLEELDFRVNVQTDLVVGKLKIANQGEMDSKLSRLGQLSAFTRQIDILMTDMATVKNIHDEFKRIGEP